MRSIQIEEFDLSDTLQCGQLFRFEQHGDWFFVTHRDKLFKVKQVGSRNKSRLYYKGVDKKYLVRFFRLNDDLGNIHRRICVDKHVRASVKKYHGLRLIRQDPWECLISFICSANSNIPRITQNLNALSKEFGKPIELDGVKSYTFPEPGSMKTLAKINKCRVGYRDKYLHAVNKQVTSAWLEDLKRTDYHDAKTSLLSLVGVGEKVADCVLLFSLDHLDSFPVDTWVKKVMQELYFGNRDVPLKRIREFAQEYFGHSAGYAQQYLFHGRRNSK